MSTEIASTETSAPESSTPDMPGLPPTAYPEESSSRARRMAMPITRVALPFVFLTVLGLLVYVDPPGTLATVVNHPSYGLWLLGCVGFSAVWGCNKYLRSVALYDTARGHGWARRLRARRKHKPQMRGLFQAIGEWVEIACFHDTRAWRVAYMTTTVVALLAGSWISIDLAPDWNFQALTQDPSTATTVLWSFLVPIVWFGVVGTRMRTVSKRRYAALEAMHAAGASSYKYPEKSNSSPKAEQIQLADPRSAVIVREWESLEFPRSGTVRKPTKHSASNKKADQEFDENLTWRLPHPEGWYFDHKPDRVVFYPAQYPASVLWDGQYDPDPLTFLLGVELDNPGEWAKLTFNTTSPNMKASGGTGSGKTNVAESICAQIGIKPMPWDPQLRGQAHIIDPQGPFANRWQGRPNITVIDGSYDGTNPATGDPESGFVRMARHSDELMQELTRRQTWMAQYPNAATWLDVSHEDLRTSRMAPLFYILDEFLDHTGKEQNEGQQAEIDNAARQRLVYNITQLTRKGRKVGMHGIIISQELKMQEVGSVLLRQLPATIVMGNSDSSDYKTMFGTTDVPVLPTTRIMKGQPEGIPGRGRIMNARGQNIRRLQCCGFGDGPQGKNIATLDKHLPRGGSAPMTSATTTTTQPRQEDIFADDTPDVSLNTPSPTPVQSATPQSDDQWCHASTCGDSATHVCHQCQHGFCGYHVEPGPDPAQSDMFCESCTESHPLVDSGMHRVFNDLHVDTTAAGLCLDWESSADGVIATARTPQARKKVFVVRAVGGELSIQTQQRSGHGLDQTFDIARATIQRYQSRHGGDPS